MDMLSRSPILLAIPRQYHRTVRTGVDFRGKFYIYVSQNSLSQFSVNVLSFPNCSYIQYNSKNTDLPSIEPILQNINLLPINSLRIDPVQILLRSLVSVTSLEALHLDLFVAIEHT
jgi:hypothetical protein